MPPVADSVAGVAWVAVVVPLPRWPEAPAPQPYADWVPGSDGAARAGAEAVVEVAPARIAAPSSLGQWRLLEREAVAGHQPADTPQDGVGELDCQPVESGLHGGGDLVVTGVHHRVILGASRSEA